VRRLRWTVALAAIAAAAVPVGSALAVDGTDHRFAFVLHGRTLTVRALDQPSDCGGYCDPFAFPSAAVRGRRVRASCGGTAGHRRPAVRQTRRWPAHALSLRFHFGRDISRRATWCLIEDARTGGDVAFAYLRTAHISGAIRYTGGDPFGPAARGPQYDNNEAGTVTLRDSSGVVVGQRRLRAGQGFDFLVAPGRFRLTAKSGDAQCIPRTVRVHAHRTVRKAWAVCSIY